MRSTDFKRQENRIKALKDIRPKKKKINWDRLLYMFILFSGIGYVLFYVIYSLTFVKGEGQVLFRKLDIQFTQDIQIIDFYKFEGDTVNVGDTLFYYQGEDLLKGNQANKYVNKTTTHRIDNDWYARERINTLRKIEVAKIELKKSQNLLSNTLTEKERIKKEIYLDVYSADKLDGYVHSELKITADIASLKKEIDFHQEYLWILSKNKKLEEAAAVRDSLAGMRIYNSRLPMKQFYTSPVKGTITRIFKENFEVALESEIVMTVHKPTNLFIKAFYEQKDLKHLQEGDIVKIKFPDGTRSEGVLQRFYFATYKLPDEFQKKYEPLTRSIAADIVPLHESDLEKWKAFYKLNVKISKNVISL